MRRLARYTLFVAGAIVMLGLVIHLPPVMHYLAAHGHHGAGVCPLGYGQAKVADAREPIAHRSALGFELGRATAGDVERWGLSHGVLCSAKVGEMECANVALDGAVSTVWFGLDSKNAVRSIRTTRRGNVAVITHEFDQLSTHLAVENGPAVKASGGELEKGALRQAMVEYRAKDYRAVLRATNFGDGFVLTEQYGYVN